MEKNSDDIDSRLQRLFACCDRSFAFYDAIVETTTNEAIMLTAQKLTSSALDRIGTFKKVFGNSYLSENSNN